MINKIIGGAVTEKMNVEGKGGVKIDALFHKKLNRLEHELKGKTVGLVGDLVAGHDLRIDDRVLIINALDHSFNKAIPITMQKVHFHSGTWVYHGTVEFPVLEHVGEFSEEMFRKINHATGNAEIIGEMQYLIALRNNHSGAGNQIPLLDRDEAVKLVFSNDKPKKTSDDVKPIYRMLSGEDNERIARLLKRHLEVTYTQVPRSELDLIFKGIDIYQNDANFERGDVSGFIKAVIKRSVLAPFTKEIEVWLKNNVEVISEIAVYYRHVKHACNEYDIPVKNLPKTTVPVVLVSDLMVERSGKYSLKKHTYAMILAALLDDQELFDKLYNGLSLFGFSSVNNHPLFLRRFFEDFRKTTDRDVSSFPADQQYLGFALLWRYQRTKDTRFIESAKQVLALLATEMHAKIFGAHGKRDRHHEGTHKRSEDVDTLDLSPRLQVVRLKDFVLPFLHYFIQYEPACASDEQRRKIEDLYYKGLRLYKQMSDLSRKYLRDIGDEGLTRGLTPFTFLFSEMHAKKDYYLHAHDFNGGEAGIKKAWKYLANLDLLPHKVPAAVKTMLDKMNVALESMDLTMDATYILCQPKHGHKELSRDLFVAAGTLPKEEFNTMTPYGRFQRRAVNRELLQLLIPDLLNPPSMKEGDDRFVPNDSAWNHLWDRRKYIVEWSLRVFLFNQELIKRAEDSVKQLKGEKREKALMKFRFPSLHKNEQLDIEAKKNDFEKFRDAHNKAFDYMKKHLNEIELDEEGKLLSHVRAMLPEGMRHQFKRMCDQMFALEGLDTYNAAVPLFWMALDMLWFKQTVRFDRTLFTSDDIVALLKDEMIRPLYTEHVFKNEAGEDVRVIRDPDNRGITVEYSRKTFLKKNVRFEHFASMDPAEISDKEIAQVVLLFDRYLWTAKSLSSQARLFAHPVFAGDTRKAQFLKLFFDAQEWKDLLSIFPDSELAMIQTENIDHLEELIRRELTWEMRDYGYNLYFSYVTLLALSKESLSSEFGEHITEFFRNVIWKTQENPTRFNPGFYRGGRMRPVDDIAQVFDPKFFAIVSLLSYIDLVGKHSLPKVLKDVPQG